MIDQPIKTFLTPEEEFQLIEESPFSKGVLQLAQKAMFAKRENLHDTVLQNLCKLEKAEAMVRILTKTKVGVATWGLARAILISELALLGIDSGEKALKYISKLAPHLAFSDQTS
jgi:hypothetical protein